MRAYLIAEGNHARNQHSSAHRISGIVTLTLFATTTIAADLKLKDLASSRSRRLLKSRPREPRSRASRKKLRRSVTEYEVETMVKGKVP